MLCFSSTIHTPLASYTHSIFNPTTKIYFMNRLATSYTQKIPTQTLCTTYLSIINKKHTIPTYTLASFANHIRPNQTTKKHYPNINTHTKPHIPIDIPYYPPKLIQY